MKAHDYSLRCGHAVVLIVLSILAAFLGHAHADGGTVIGQGRGEGMLVTVFAQPFPLRAGPVDFSILVQDEATRQPVLNATAGLRLKKLSAPTPESAWTSPLCTMPGPDGRIPLTRSAANNKILYAAMPAVPEPGRWELSFDVIDGNRRATFSLKADAASPLGPWVAWWPALATLPAAIALYAWRAGLLRSRRTSKSSRSQTS